MVKLYRKSHPIKVVTKFCMTFISPEWKWCHQHGHVCKARISVSIVPTKFKPAMILVDQSFRNTVIHMFSNIL